MEMTARQSGVRGASHRHLRQGGFTLVEMLTTLTVAGILTATAVPSFTSVILNQGVKTTAFDLVSALSYARSEAIKRNRPVTLRPLDNDWQQTWVVCAPKRTPTVLEQGRCGAGETELRDWAHPDRLAIAAGRIGGRDTVNSVTFRSDGRVANGVVFNLCDRDGSASVTRRIIRLDPSGRPNLKYGSACGT